jgi:hypothetical protein
MANQFEDAERAGQAEQETTKPKGRVAKGEPKASEQTERAGQAEQIDVLLAKVEALERAVASQATPVPSASSRPLPPPSQLEPKSVRQRKGAEILAEWEREAREAA